MLEREEIQQLYRYALSLTHNEENAYDLLQSALEKFVKADTKKVENKKAYLFTIVRNQFLDWQRMNKQALLEKVVDNIEEPETATDLETVYIQKNEVEAILAESSPQERETAYLWAVEEYSYSEIAKLQNSSRNTILSRMHRWKQRIRKIHESKSNGGSECKK